MLWMGLEPRLVWRLVRRLLGRRLEPWLLRRLARRLGLLTKQPDAFTFFSHPAWPFDSYRIRSARSGGPYIIPETL